jgi:hypothetical protein
MKIIAQVVYYLKIIVYYICFSNSRINHFMIANPEMQKVEKAEA